MQKFIHNLALLACLMVLCCGLWQDWAVWLTVKRMIIGYLVFFCGGSGLFIAFKAVHLLDPAPGKSGSERAARKASSGR